MGGPILPPRFDRNGVDKHKPCPSILAHRFPSCIPCSRASVARHAARRPSYCQAPSAEVTLALRCGGGRSASSCASWGGWSWWAVQKKCSWKPPVLGLGKSECWGVSKYEHTHPQNISDGSISRHGKRPPLHARTHPPEESRPSFGSTFRQRLSRKCKCRPTLAPGENVRINSGPARSSSSGRVVGAAVGAGVGAGVGAEVGA